MKVYVEEIEDLSTHGVTNYSLVRGMEFYDAEVRASGIEILNRDGTEIDNDELYNELENAVVKEVYRNV